MHVYTHGYIYTGIPACLSTYIHIYLHENMNAYTLACLLHTYLHTIIHTYTYTFMHICLHTSISTCIQHICMSAFIYISMEHTYIHKLDSWIYVHALIYAYIHTWETHKCLIQTYRQIPMLSKNVHTYIHTSHIFQSRNIYNLALSIGPIYRVAYFQSFHNFHTSRNLIIPEI